MAHIVTTQVLHDGAVVVVYWRQSLKTPLRFTLAEVREGAIVYEDVSDTPPAVIEAIVGAVRTYREESV